MLTCVLYFLFTNPCLRVFCVFCTFCSSFRFRVCVKFHTWRKRQRLGVRFLLRQDLHCTNSNANANSNSDSRPFFCVFELFRLLNCTRELRPNHGWVMFCAFMLLEKKTRKYICIKLVQNPNIACGCEPRDCVTRALCSQCLIISPCALTLCDCKLFCLSDAPVPPLPDDTLVTRIPVNES